MDVAPQVLTRRGPRTAVSAHTTVDAAPHGVGVAEAFIAATRSAAFIKVFDTIVMLLRNLHTYVI